MIYRARSDIMLVSQDTYTRAGEFNGTSIKILKLRNGACFYGCTIEYILSDIKIGSRTVRRGTVRRRDNSP